MNRYEPAATELYKDVIRFLAGKDYFVITTNVDGQFRKAGIDSNRLFEVQGDYAYIQCKYGCHNKLYYNEETVNEMLAATVDCRIPASMVPKCPVCGGEMDVNLRKDQYFVQDDNWYAASARYSQFLLHARNKPAVFIEIGVGFNTPAIIRYSFEEMVYKNPKATLIRINKDFSAGIRENKNSTISFDEDVRTVMCGLSFTSTHP